MKNLSPKALSKRINAYFERISLEVPLTVDVQTGISDNGRPVTERVPLTEKGLPVKRRIYALPPTLSDLCLYLGISRQELLSLYTGEAYRQIIDRTRTRMEAYLEQELLLREKTTGVTELLKLSDRWNGTIPVPEESMTMEEREEILRRIAEDFTEKGKE